MVNEVKFCFSIVFKTPNMFRVNLTWGIPKIHKSEDKTRVKATNRAFIYVLGIDTVIVFMSSRTLLHLSEKLDEDLNSDTHRRQETGKQKTSFIILKAEWVQKSQGIQNAQ